MDDRNSMPAASASERALTILVAAFVVAGVVLVVKPLLDARAGHRLDASSGVGAEPAWYLAAPPKRNFTAAVEPAGPSIDRFEKLLASLRFTPGAVPDAGSAFLRTTRVMANGHEYDAEARLSFERDVEHASVEVRLAVQRGSDDRIDYRLSATDGVVEMSMETPTDDGGSERSLLGSGANMPVGLGDLQVRDIHAVFDLLGPLLFGSEAGASALLRPGCLTALGVSEGPSTTSLLVFELAFDCLDQEPPWDRAARESVESYMGKSHTALIYVHEPRQLRTVRIFDRDGRLVRTYDGFVFEDDDHPWPRAFRVTSLPSQSYTLFRLTFLPAAE